VILSSFLAALGQLGDARFLRVTVVGIALAIALLLGFALATAWFLEQALPDSVVLPWVGPVDWIGAALGWGTALLIMVLSVFLMVPVASAFSGLFLDSVADAVEVRHYPDLPPVRPAGLWDSLVGSINFLGVLVAVNILALALWPLAGPFVPVLFWGVNGYLLGREYFELAAARRLGRPAARALRKANAGTVWMAGILMAAPLSLPVANLVIPVLGAATFTHLFHKLRARAPR
jgi:CysZ protein